MGEKIYPSLKTRWCKVPQILVGNFPNKIKPLLIETQEKGINKTTNPSTKNCEIFTYQKTGKGCLDCGWIKRCERLLFGPVRVCFG